MSAALFLLIACSAAAQTLSFDEAVRRAVDSSPAVRSAAARRDAAALEEPLLLSLMDPRLDASYRYADDRAPRALPAFEGPRRRVETWEGGLTQTTLLGSEARLFWRGERLTNPSLFRPLDPTVDSRLGLDLRQNLLRRFWGRPDKARRSSARMSLAAAERELAGARADAAARAASAWLELRAAEKLIALRQGGVADAERLLSRTKEKSRYGTAEDSELLQARASLEAAETELLLARSALERARHALAAALRLDGPSAALAVSSGPAGGPEPPSVGEEAALDANPAVAAARRRREAAEWDARLTRLDTLPELSLDANYVFAGLDTGWRRAWNDTRTWRHPVASVGVSASVPLGFWKERLTRRQAKARLEQAAAEAAAVEVEARRDWRDARETLALAGRRLAAARRLAELERDKAAAGEADFRRGRASTDLLVRFQADLRRARAELLRAETDEALARVELARQAGSVP